MVDDLAQKAINEAISGNWEEALKINLEVLKSNKKDVDALNRLSRAYAELGDIPKAKIISNKVLKIDSLNKIALRCCDKYKDLKKGDTTRSQVTSGSAFIEEPGKTKIVPLLHVGGEKILAKLDAGDEVRLNPHGHRLSVVTIDGKYIGRLPDDIGAKLKKLIKMGNEYQILIKSTKTNEINVFIRETKSSPKVGDIPSFTGEKIDYVSFIAPGLVPNKDRVMPPAED